jgi:hypothetical protein
MRPAAGPAGKAAGGQGLIRRARQLPDNARSRAFRRRRQGRHSSRMPHPCKEPKEADPALPWPRERLMGAHPGAYLEDQPATANLQPQLRLGHPPRPKLRSR